MALSELLLNKISTPGLWFVKSKTIVKDISQLIFDLAVNGAVYLTIYSSEKDSIVNSVLSMITKDRLQTANDSHERFCIEDDLSFYYECGHFWIQEELNDYIPNGSFWEDQVWIYDYDSLFIENSGRETILLDDINMLNTQDYVSLEGALRHIERRALQNKNSVFVFVHDYSSDLTNGFIRNRLINAQIVPPFG